MENLKTLGQRLAHARKAKGLGQQPVADRFKITVSAVSQWENDTTTPELNKLRILSGMLGVSLAYLLNGDGDPPPKFEKKSNRAPAMAQSGALAAANLDAVMTIGAVQAGVWAEALKWPPDEHYPAPVARDRRYPDIKQFGLEVRGPSMNELYPGGSVVICVDLLEVKRDPKPGERVVVQRQSDLGMEATIKELRQDDGGEYWLWPRSTDPNFQQPWKLPKPADGDEEETIRIVALVIGAYKPEG